MRIDHHAYQRATRVAGMGFLVQLAIGLTLLIFSLVGAESGVQDTAFLFGSLYIVVGLYEDGRPGELFLTMGKEGSTLGGLLDSIGVLTSVSLQYGVPLEALVRKFSHCRFEPSGWTKNPDIRQATSIVDYIFRWLGTRFLANGNHESASENANGEGCDE